jgi:hypothetical protein
MYFPCICKHVLYIEFRSCSVMKLARNISNVVGIIEHIFLTEDDN